ncbi:hypothetical protein ACHAXS_005279 [Conticribra weissflogii]
MTSQLSSKVTNMEELESILVEEMMNSLDIDATTNNNSHDGKEINANIHNSNNNSPLNAFKRAREIGSVLVGSVAAPILVSYLKVIQNQRQNQQQQQDGGQNTQNFDWNSFWLVCTDDNTGFIHGGKNNGKTNAISHAERLTKALEQLGPTYVKFGQALASRPDVVPPSLAAALSTLQDQMTRFDGQVACDIVTKELMPRVEEGSIEKRDLEDLLASMVEEPVAAASIGQVYKANLPGKGSVAVKVQRPGVRLLVESDTELLLTVAKFLEYLPGLPNPSSGNNEKNNNNDNGDQSKPSRLINTQLVSATQEFMSRIFEELDYRNEAANCKKFADLYSCKSGTSKDVSVVVPEVYLDWCTENVLVMEWIDGTKLTDVSAVGNGGSERESADEGNGVKGEGMLAKDSVEENLALVKVAIDSTLSQLLVTGILHADPHAGNLLKIRLDDGTVTLGYLDFGLLSTIPMKVRDALVCSVALQVFSRDVDAVSSLFGELQLIPQHILDDESERLALAEALEITFENSLKYTDSTNSSPQNFDDATTIPELKFDKLLDSLSRLVPRFQFDLPPYFINNARALSTLEGIARSLDPTFNVLTIMYPYALNRLLRNPSQSPVVERTLQQLIRSEVDGRFDKKKVMRLLRDSATISGLPKRRVVWDVMKEREGRKLVMDILKEELSYTIKGSSLTSSRDLHKGPEGKKRKWYYLEL